MVRAAHESASAGELRGDYGIAQWKLGRPIDLEKKQGRIARQAGG